MVTRRKLHRNGKSIVRSPAGADGSGDGMNKAKGAVGDLPAAPGGDRRATPESALEAEVWVRLGAAAGLAGRRARRTETRHLLRLRRPDLGGGEAVPRDRRRVPRPPRAGEEERLGLDRVLPGARGPSREPQRRETAMTAGCSSTASPAARPRRSSRRSGSSCATSSRRGGGAISPRTPSTGATPSAAGAARSPLRSREGAPRRVPRVPRRLRDQFPGRTRRAVPVPRRRPASELCIRFRVSPRRRPARPHQGRATKHCSTG